jgi:uncharacterized coiled-coil DUF342 family protein
MATEKSSYSGDDEAAAVQSANNEFEKAVARLARERDGAIAAAHESFEQAVKPHREKRDRLYAQAHEAYYQHQVDSAEMSEEARELLRRQLAGEVAWDSSVGNVNELQVDDNAKGADSGR